MKKYILLILVLVSSVSINAGFFNCNDGIKQSLAILPFENDTGNSENNHLIMDCLRMLFHKLYIMGEFRLIEMEKIGDIIGEKLDFGRNYDRDAYIKAVKSLGVELILFGNITKLEKTITQKATVIELQIETRIVRLLTGEIISFVKKGYTIKKKNSNTQSIKEMTDKALEKCLKATAKKLVRDASK